jgi:putative N6-adenine-specific DNA methylase
VSAPIYARDFDEEALQSARANFKAAGITNAITVELADATKADPPAGAAGLLATNPPYGDRLGGGRGQKGIKSFYFKLGEALTRWKGWRMAVLAGNDAFESAFHARPTQRMTLWNGPIECQLLQYPGRPDAR